MCTLHTFFFFSQHEGWKNVYTWSFWVIFRFMEKFALCKLWETKKRPEAEVL